MHVNKALKNDSEGYSEHRPFLYERLTLMEHCLLTYLTENIKSHLRVIKSPNAYLYCTSILFLTRRRLQPLVVYRDLSVHHLQSAPELLANVVKTVLNLHQRSLK